MRGRTNEGRRSVFCSTYFVGNTLATRISDPKSLQMGSEILVDTVSVGFWDLANVLPTKYVPKNHRIDSKFVARATPSVGELQGARP